MSETKPRRPITSPKPSPHRRGLTRFARHLRRDQTEAEALLWSRLRSRQLLGLKFRRHLPTGTHVADFPCDAAKLVNELDGAHHAQSSTDRARTSAIAAAAYLVLRFWNNDVLENTEGVLEEIARTLRIASSSSPSPQGRG